MSASAAEEYMKGMDKGYITFIFDDNRSCTKELYQLFSKYNMPLSCAVIAQQVESNPTMQQTLMDIQNGTASNPQTPDKTPADDKENSGDTTNKDTENNDTVNKDNTENSTTDNNSSNNTVLYSKEKTNLTTIIIFGVAALVLIVGTVVTLLTLQNKKKKK